MRKLLYEYKHTLKNIRKAKLDANTEERSIISGMEADLEYAIEWIEKSGKPDRQRGIDRVNIYVTDPATIDGVQYDILGKQSIKELSEKDRNRINDALSMLSDREREVYILHVVELYSLEEIAMLLDMKKGTVQCKLKRAEHKITKQVERMIHS